VKHCGSRALRRPTGIQLRTAPSAETTSGAPVTLEPKVGATVTVEIIAGALVIVETTAGTLLTV